MTTEASTAEGQPDAADARRLVGGVKHWHHKFEVFPGVVTPGTYDPGFLYHKLGRTAWDGLRVLDVGPSDGFFSKRIAEVGGDVVSLDYRPKNAHGFGVMEQLSPAKFDYRVGNVFSLSEAGFGLFDTVLLLGVLYHLPDPLRALRACRSVCRGSFFVETWFDDTLPADIPLARYLPTSPEGDPSNFWVPNRLCLLNMVTDAGFDVLRDEAGHDRLFLEARVSGHPDAERRMRIAYADNVGGL